MVFKVFQKLFTTLYNHSIINFLLLWNYLLILKMLTDTRLRISFYVIKTADQRCYEFLLIQQNKFFRLNVKILDLPYKSFTWFRFLNRYDIVGIFPITFFFKPWRLLTRVSTEFRRRGIPRNFLTSEVISAQFRRNSAKFRGIPRNFAGIEPEITSVFRGMPKCHFRGHPTSNKCKF